MRLGTRRTNAGRVDGGAGRGVRLGGSDTGIRPAGSRRQDNDVVEDETAIDEAQVSVDDYANLLEDDENSADRRRDPLRQ